MRVNVGGSGESMESAESRDERSSLVLHITSLPPLVLDAVFAGCQHWVLLETSWAMVSLNVAESSLEHWLL